MLLRIKHRFRKPNSHYKIEAFFLPITGQKPPIFFFCIFGLYLADKKIY